MKAVQKSFFVCLLALFQLLAAQAQPPAPHHRHARPHLQATQLYTGTLEEWVSNHDFAIDGFYLKASNGQSYLIKFPPHMGESVYALVKQGTKVQVNGVLHTPPHGGTEVRMVSLTVGNQTLYDMPPLGPPPHHTETAVSGSAKINGFQYGHQGELIGIYLSDNSLLRIPPHLGYQLSTLLSKGSSISYAGVVHENKVGHHYLKQMRVVHATTITTGQTTYALR